MASHVARGARRSSTDLVEAEASAMSGELAAWRPGLSAGIVGTDEHVAELGTKIMRLTEEQTSEIATARAQVSQTSRPTVPDLEAILHQAFPVLDHGFVRVVDYMGDDAAVVQAARVSYGRGTRRMSEDRSLIRYLMSHWHSTPFEMAEIKLHVKLPIFVARQWIRHRMASVNEYSARYSILDREFYVPEPENLAAQSSTNRQGRDSVLSEEEAAAVLTILREDADRNYESYLWMLNEGTADKAADPARLGVARELARMNLTLSSYTQWYWKIDLHNLFGFLRLRADKHAQYEIRVYAETILTIVSKWVPHSYEAFQDYRMESTSLSRGALEVVKRMIAGEVVTQENSGLPTREWSALVDVLGTVAPVGET